MAGIVINALQCATADSGLSEASRACVQCGKPLIETQITGCAGQSGNQRIKRFDRHVVGHEEFGIGQCGLH